MARTLAPALLALLLVACDVIDEPIEPGNGPAPPPQEVTRNVLLEEFTGHRCSTCPAAHLVAKQLDNLYGDRLVVVGIHATNTFAAPLSPPAPDGRYSTDFRTPAGDAYTNAFGVSFLPTGVVSRKPYNGSMTKAQGTWGSAISALVNEPAAFALRVAQAQYNAGQNKVNILVEAITLRNVEADHKLTLYILEDNVVDWQLNAQAPVPDVPDYLHRHVLRTTVNGTWGELAIPAGTQTGDTLRFEYPNVDVDPAWNGPNCSVVAYLHHATTNEVVQVVEKFFQP